MNFLVFVRTDSITTLQCAALVTKCIMINAAHFKNVLTQLVEERCSGKHQSPHNQPGHGLGLVTDTQQGWKSSNLANIRNWVTNWGLVLNLLQTPIIKVTQRHHQTMTVGCCCSQTCDQQLSDNLQVQSGCPDIEGC